MFRRKLRRWALIGLAATAGLWMGAKSQTVFAQETTTAPAATSAPANDPSGTATGGAGDVTAKVPGKPTLDEVVIEVGHTKIAVNFVWMLLCGFLVFFMQAGFALLETGFVRSKNAAHVMFMNLSIFFIGVLGYWVCGFALQMGNV